MARTRTIYASQSLSVGPSPATGQHYSNSGVPAGGTNLVSGLYRIQDCSFGFNIPRTPVNQFGELAFIDQVNLEQPSVNLSFSYLQANLHNEKTMGFSLSSGGKVSFVSGIINKQTDGKNFFLEVAPEGTDSIGLANPSKTTIPVYAFGNGFITSYNAEGSVGSFPRVSVGVEALNLNFNSSGSGATIPAVFPDNGTAVTNWTYQLPVALSSPTHLSGISVLRPGDITLTLGYNEGGADTTDLKIQSYSLGLNLSRQQLLKLGSKYAFSRELQFPIPVTLSVTADVGDFKSGSLIDIVNNNTDYNLAVDIKAPGTTTTAVNYQILQANLDSQEFSNSIGPNSSVTLNFSSQLGSSSQTNIGLFCSGNN